MVVNDLNLVLRLQVHHYSSALVVSELALGDLCVGLDHEHSASVRVVRGVALEVAAGDVDPRAHHHCDRGDLPVDFLEQTADVKQKSTRGRRWIATF